MPLKISSLISSDYSIKKLSVFLPHCIELMAPNGRGPLLRSILVASIELRCTSDIALSLAINYDMMKVIDELIECDRGCIVLQEVVAVCALFDPSLLYPMIELLRSKNVQSKCVWSVLISCSDDDDARHRADALSCLSFHLNNNTAYMTSVFQHSTISNIPDDLEHREDRFVWDLFDNIMTVQDGFNITLSVMTILIRSDKSNVIPFYHVLEQLQLSTPVDIGGYAVLDKATKTTTLLCSRPDASSLGSVNAFLALLLLYRAAQNDDQKQELKLAMRDLMKWSILRGM